MMSEVPSDRIDCRSSDVSMFPIQSVALVDQRLPRTRPKMASHHHVYVWNTFTMISADNRFLLQVSRWLSW